MSTFKTEIPIAVTIDNPMRFEDALKRRAEKLGMSASALHRQLKADWNKQKQPAPVAQKESA